MRLEHIRKQEVAFRGGILLWKELLLSMQSANQSWPRGLSSTAVLDLSTLDVEYHYLS